MPAALGARKEPPPCAVWWEMSDAASESGVVRAALPEVRRSLWADINAANVSAGVAAGLWYAFAIPLRISAAEKLHLSPAVASSWFIWLTGAMAASR
jgi:hypothetical protein